ncbi:glycosyltransferase [Massilimicrobiota sp. An80]|uniref:glycosyltransferase n=1 Tax=Massilimicrobiota sp. An80 TaxID=1965658 RepID=UPI000B453B5F|nr:glycosyltransferase [Massilimicrobiota sp. An80]OUN37272.1 hypothetical protein B5G32_04700 [Massilimicrobiota sp. An80]
MKKLAVFTLYSKKGASSNYRAYIFKDEFEKNFYTQYFCFWNDKYTAEYMWNKKKYKLKIGILYLIGAVKRLYQLYFIAPQFDVVFIQKGVIPKYKWTMLEHLKRQGIRIVFDVDDAIYELKRDNSDRIAQKSDAVICGNETLKKHYERVNPNCIILPTIEDTTKYEPYWRQTFSKKIIGWIGSETTIDNLELIVEPINELIQQHPEVSFHIISNTALEFTERIRNSKLIVWSENDYIRNISDFTIGIMPLKNNKINRGKCGFKLIQYLNMKKPVVGSPVGVNESIIKGNGITANSKEEWIDAFETLLYQEDRYYGCISHIETDFFREYHFQNVSKKLIEILKS